MTTVFVNYRTSDEETAAALLEHALSERFASNVFFRASKSIKPGDDFEEELLKGVRTSSVLLAVIGSHWLEVRDEHDVRKINKASDWVRREIVEAFDLGIRVVPVLIGETKPLQRDALPAGLERLATCQYVRLRNRDLEADLDRIAATLTELVPELRDARVVPPDAGTVTNNAFGNARVGLQAGNVVGDINFGDFLTRDEQDGR
ncbi:toll/interleukin-1 receptor domain-containing protein [Actinoallomurus acaciae]|uniref:Toll/interleukin-1 receptor domain-containing protein n=1 Tax=Actinoallomurus acaciae TaxID=502577 RepID=A0ABV5YEL3_9ACTN